jgi:signal peptidase I
MSKKTKNIIIYTFLGLVVLIILLYKFLPAETIINLAGKDNAVSNTLCTLPVKVLGDSMDPILKNGEKANFNKCFEVGEISKNTILMFKEGTNNRLAVVKQMEGEKLKLFQPNRGDQVIAEILIEDVVAIYAEKYSGGF